MKNYKQDLKSIWQQWYGNKFIVQDVSGREISFYEHNTNTNASWNIDHIKPKSTGGNDVIENLIPVHIKTNKEKDNSFPIFHANNMKIVIKKSKKLRNGKNKKGWSFYDGDKKII